MIGSWACNISTCSYSHSTCKYSTCKYLFFWHWKSNCLCSKKLTSH